MTDREFFRRSVLNVAPDLIGMSLIRTFPDGSQRRLIITETEAYAGEGDTACHAFRGRNKRSEMLYHDGGTIFVYLCYGMHWLMNIVTGTENDPQGVLIRACQGFEGPGRLTKALGIDKSFDGQDILTCPALRLEGTPNLVDIISGKRIGIKYAAPEDQERLWRFILKR